MLRPLTRRPLTARATIDISSTAEAGRRPGERRAPERELFGHPFGLATLFLTEMWERFSFYGMRAILILYMTDSLHGGLGWDIQKSSAVYGLYTFGVYALGLPGGWIADRLIGQRRSVLCGGIIIALGHFTLAAPHLWTFFAGLLLVMIGTGLLKPNVSAIVADLYPEGGARRDAGFSIFYMGINTGAVIGQFICGFLGEKVGWHWGFGAAGVGMTLGVIQYAAGRRHLLGCGEVPADYSGSAQQRSAWRQFFLGITIVVALVGVISSLDLSGVQFSLQMGGAAFQLLPLSFLSFAQATGALIAVICVVYFAATMGFACHDGVERRRVAMIFLLFLAAAVFWSGFEQMGSSMNLFARDFTDRIIFGWQMPASWLQNVDPLFIILLAPVIGQLWVSLGARNPSIPVKFGMGLALLGTGFLVLAWGATYIHSGKVSPMWLVVTYFFTTVGELCLSPVGLSSVTKLSPTRMVGQMMGMWFMGSALGNLIAGLVAGYLQHMQQDTLFAMVALTSVATGLLFLILARPIQWLAVGVR